MYLPRGVCTSCTLTLDQDQDLFCSTTNIICFSTVYSFKLVFSWKLASLGEVEEQSRYLSKKNMSCLFLQFFGNLRLFTASFCSQFIQTSLKLFSVLSWCTDWVSSMNWPLSNKYGTGVRCWKSTTVTTCMPSNGQGLSNSLFIWRCIMTLLASSNIHLLDMQTSSHMRLSSF